MREDSKKGSDGIGGFHETLSSPLVVASAFLAALIYVGAFLSQRYFTIEPLLNRPMAILMGIGQKTPDDVLPIIRLASWIGGGAGILAVSFGLYLSIKARKTAASELLAETLIVTALGFALLHYFPFMVNLQPRWPSLDALLQVAGVVLVIVGSVFWLRWTGIYPRPMSLLEYRSEAHKRNWLRRYWLAHKRGMPSLVRWMTLMACRWARIERRYFGKFATVNATNEEFRFLRRTQSNRWLFAVCASMATVTLAPLFSNGYLLQFFVPLRDGSLLMFLGFLCVVANGYLQYSFGLADETGRRKILWLWVLPSAVIILILLFLAIMVVLLLSAHGKELRAAFIAQLAVLLATFGLALVLAIMISVLSRGAIDPRLAIGRTAIYAAIAVLMTSLFVAMEAMLSTQAVTHFGLPNETGAVVAGVGAALMFGPVRNRIESAVNRWVRRILPPSNLVEGGRRRSAVAFNDLGGYTRLLEIDERLALLVAAVFHREAFSTAARHEGRVVKTIGRAAMLEFTTVSTTVSALRELHRNFAATCRHLRMEALPVHSGVHVGEVFRAQDGDIHGQAVNIAARLEGVAGPNEIVLSEAAWQDLPERESFSAMGERALKNVAAAVRCYGSSTV